MMSHLTRIVLVLLPYPSIHVYTALPLPIKQVHLQLHASHLLRPPLRPQVDLLSVEDVALRLSFKPDPTSRPRHAGGLLSLGLELAALDNLAMELPGRDCKV